MHHKRRMAVCFGAQSAPYDAKGSRKNNFTFYPSRIQVIFARSEDTKSSKELAIPPVLHLQIEQI
jgi:hypothetical protein